MYRNVFIVFIVICLLSILLSFQFYSSLHSTIKEESKRYLQEVTRRIGDNINRIITDNYAVLHTMASTLETTKDKLEFEDIKRVLHQQKSYWNYKDIYLIDSNGKAYDLNDREVSLNIDEGMREDILNQREAMSTTQMIDNQEYILFSVPLKQVTVDGKQMEALAASYVPSSFDQVLTMSSFDQQAYSQIVTKSGTVVTRSTTENAMKTGYNVFTSIQSGTLDAGYSFDKMREDISSDHSDVISFTLDGVRRYMIYTPIQPEEWYLLTFVPVQVVNERSDALLQVTLVLCSLVAVVFMALILALVYTFENNKKKLERIAYVDSVTGGNTIGRFYQLAENILNSTAQGQYALVYTNIEKFKVMNEQMGRENCDKLLKSFSDFIAEQLREQECMGRLTADNFCILMQYDGEKTFIDRLVNWIADAEKSVAVGKMPWSLPILEFGIYVVERRDIPFSQMVDRAKLALKESAGSIDNKLRYAFYDDRMRKQLFREKLLEDMMDHALESGEFQMYLQPKFRVSDEKIGGAEALVRWNSSSEGMIYPNEFIPLFEKNGFIVRLDMWMFEEVCRHLRIWLDKGLSPVKISVNCSRVNLRERGFLKEYQRIALKYRIPRQQVEIELTESIVLEETEHLTQVIDEIRGMGFGCSMDDFGSGYSSLNMIQTVPVDTLKLDKIFFQGGSQELERTEAVVGSIVRMADALSMETVAEGVEYREQVEMLRKVGCTYIQGYVFAKPMPVENFEKIAFEEGTI